VRSDVAAAAGMATGQAYDEETFHQLLAAEHKRSERTGRPYLVLLAELHDRRVPRPTIDPAVAATIFAGLRLSLRETDVIGWYVADRVPGAVLADQGSGSQGEVCRAIRQRVYAVLGAQLPSDVVRQLDVRVHAHAGPGRIDANAT